MLACVTVTSVTAQQSMDEALEDCSRSQRSMNLCSQHGFEVADKELNELYAKQLKGLTDAGNRKRLAAAQRAWITFRDQDCAYQLGPPDASGRLPLFDYYGCMSTRTQQRIQDLRQYLECTSNGCPE